MKEKRFPYHRFSSEFKLGVVEEYLTGVKPSSLCKKHCISKGALYDWIHIFAPEYKFDSAIMAKKDPESAKIEELKKALRQKELELKREKMRADFYETMVDVAEEQFNITIRKKAGTKQ